MGGDWLGLAWRGWDGTGVERQGLTTAGSAFGEGVLQCGEVRERKGLEGNGGERTGADRTGREGRGPERQARGAGQHTKRPANSLLLTG